MRPALALAVWTLGGCVSTDTAAEATYAPTSGTDTQVLDAEALRIDLFPSSVLGPDGAIRALPRTEGPVAFDAIQESLPLGELELAPPGVLSGLVTGFLAAPQASGAQLPGMDGPIEAVVELQRPNSVQRYSTTTLEDGFFDLDIVGPEGGYVLSVVPTSPEVPVYTEDIKLERDGGVRDVQLGLGVALYGRISQPNGEPLANSRVQVVNPWGVASAVASTDSEGWYLIRVEPGDYTVLSFGRDHGRDPLLTFSDVQVDESGARLDVNYPALGGELVLGRVLDDQGLPVAGATVRLTAKSITGYEELNAALVIEEATDADGNYDLQVLDGAYALDFMPPVEPDPSRDLSPLQLQFVSGDSVGTTFLDPLTEVSGRVTTPVGDPVEEARVTCTEDGFGGRSWSGYTQADGTWTLDLPSTPLNCTLTPPVTYVGILAWTRFSIDPSTSDRFDVEAKYGIDVNGQMRVGGLGEAFGIVEIRSEAGVLLGSGATDEEGRFSVRVDLENDAL